MKRPRIELWEGFRGCQAGVIGLAVSVRSVFLRTFYFLLYISASYELSSFASMGSITHVVSHAKGAVCMMDSALPTCVR